jgi:hypothetical protein
MVGGFDEGLSANVFGKPCVGKPQARFDEKALETCPGLQGGAPGPYSMSVTKAAMEPDGCKESFQVSLGRLVAGSRERDSNDFFLSGSTKALLEGRSKGTGRNMREPRCSLVNMKVRRASLYRIGEANSLRDEPRMAETSSGVSGATRPEGAIAERERPAGSKRPAYKHRRRNGGLIVRESDKPIVAMKPRKAEPWRAKGLDLDGAAAWGEGKGIGDEPINPE